MQKCNHVQICTRPYLVYGESISFTFQSVCLCFQSFLSQNRSLLLVIIWLAVFFRGQTSAKYLALNVSASVKYVCMFFFLSSVWTTIKGNKSIMDDVFKASHCGRYSSSYSSSPYQSTSAVFGKDEYYNKGKYLSTLIQPQAYIKCQKSGMLHLKKYCFASNLY